MTDEIDWIAAGFYWLHIRPDGKGERFEMSERERVSPWNHAPYRRVPCLAVRIVHADGVVFEEVKTSNLRGGRELWTAWTMVRPRGDGWAIFDDRSDHWTVWRRKAELS